VGTITTGTWQGTTVAVNQGGTGVTSLGSLNISSFNNDSGFTANSGDITGVTAGTGLSGGGSSGSVTLNVDAAQTGITSLGTQAADFIVGNGYGIVVGHSAQVATNFTSKLQVIGDDNNESSMSIQRYSDDATAAFLWISKSRGALGTPGTEVVDNDGIGEIRFTGDDGGDLATSAVAIRAEVDDASIGENEVGGALVISTAPGASANDLTEALRIDSSRRLVLAQSASDTIQTDGTYIRKDASGNLEFDSQGGYTFNVDTNNNDTGSVLAVASNASATNVFEVSQTGNVTIDGGGVVTPNSYSKLVIDTADHTRFEFLNPNDKVGTIWFSDPEGEGMGRIEYSHAANQFEFRTNQTIALTISSAYLATFTGNIVVGGTGDGTISASNDLILQADEDSGDSGSRIQFRTDGANCGNFTGNDFTSTAKITAGTDINIATTNKLYFDGGDNTYIYEESDDDLHIVVGGQAVWQYDQDINAGVYGAGDPTDKIHHLYSGAFESGGSSTYATYMTIGGSVEGHSGDSGYVSLLEVNGSTEINGNAAVVAALKVDEPALTETSGNAAIAASIYVTDAPTEGTQNYALHIASGAVGVAGSAGTDGQVLTSGGANANAAWEDAGGGGLEYTTQYRLSADTARGYLTSNWEVPDTEGYGTLGTAVGESSGVFSFPSTGYWLITFTATGGDNNDSQTNYIQAYIYTTTDGTNYTSATMSRSGHHYYQVASTVTTSFLFDVTNVSTHLVKLYAYTQYTDWTLRGDTGQNETHVTFTKLGDT
jgi:hypothetical protein